MENSTLKVENGTKTPPSFEDHMSSGDLVLFCEIAPMLKALERNFVNGWDQGGFVGIPLYRKDMLLKIKDLEQEAAVLLNVQLLHTQLGVKYDGDIVYPVLPETASYAEKLPNIKAVARKIVLTRESLERQHTLPEAVAELLETAPDGLPGVISTKYGIQVEVV